MLSLDPEANEKLAPKYIWSAHPGPEELGVTILGLEGGGEIVFRDPDAVNSGKDEKWEKEVRCRIERWANTCL